MLHRLRAGMAAAMLTSALLVPPPITAAPMVNARVPLPTDRLHFGLGNDPGQESWFTTSGVPWRYRYAYLAGGINNAGGTTDPCGANGGWQTWNSPAGAYATYYMQNSAADHAIPVFTYYEINQSNPSAYNESAELTKVSNVCMMQAYWADFTVLMQKAGAFGGQVVVHVEPDFWGFMEHQSADPTALAAVVASSGDPDLSGLPNTVAGMGLAFLKLRDKYAPNALLAIHASSWASGVDIASDTRTTVDANAEADKVAAFIAKCGAWDAVFNDVADHDSGYSGIWWDRNNAVFPNFSRWLAFMSRLHADIGLPLVEWQVPVGNQYFRTMNNTSGHYQDNRAEYFLAHPDQLTASGIVAVLFGKANAGQTDYTDDDGDGVTNPSPISAWQCNLCNNHSSAWPDDDGGYLRIFVGQYYGITPCATASLSAAPASPASPGASVTWTGTAGGCPNPRYRFWELDPGSRWSMVQDYSSTSTYAWRSPSLVGTYRFEVDVRDASSAEAYDAVALQTYVLGVAACTNAMLSVAPPTPGATGVAVTMTGSSSSCPHPVYRFWVKDPGSRWSMVQDYSAANTHVWAQTGLAGSYALEVDVRDASESTAYDTVANLTYAVNGCSAVTLSATPSAPQVHGTGISLSAAPTCPGTASFRFWVRAPGGAWQVIRNYSTSNTVSWTPAVAGTWSLEVDVRDQNATSSYEAVFNTTFVAT